MKRLNTHTPIPRNAFRTLLCGLWLLVFHSILPAQGAWLPANANPAYPRTLLRSADIPAVQAWMAQPEPYFVLQSLYATATDWNATTFTTDFTRRWSAHAAKDMAFLLTIDRKPTLAGVPDTLPDSERVSFTNRTLFFLNNLNPSVSAFPTVDPWLIRSNELMDYLCAWDLMKGLGTPDSLLQTSRSLLQDFAGNLYRESSVNLFGFGFWNQHINNHALRTGAALGMAAVVLNDLQSTDINEQPLNWIHAALWHTDNTLFTDNLRQSHPSLLLGYAEGPHYLRYGMKHMLPWMRALRNFVPDTTFTATWEVSTRNIRHPFYDPRYDLLWDWALRIRMPDGTYPPIEDSFMDAAPVELALTEDPRWTVPFQPRRLNTMQEFTLRHQLTNSTDDLRADWLSVPFLLPAPDTACRFCPERLSGNLVFRSGWDADAIYLHANAENAGPRLNSKGHNQGDASSFLLYAWGKMMALDPGYLKYDRRGEVGNAGNHNLVLVNGAGPLIGSVGNANDADAFLEDAFDFRHLDYAEIRTTYQGTTVRRRFAFVRNRAFLLNDALRNTQTATYQWRLHGQGLAGGDSLVGDFGWDAGRFLGEWILDSVHLRAQVATTDQLGTLSTGLEKHEIAYDTAAWHSYLAVEIAGQSQADFVTSLVPYVNDTPVTEILNHTGAAGMAQHWADGHDFWLARPAAGSLTLNAGTAGISHSLDAQAESLLWQEDAAGTWQAFSLDNLTQLTVDGQPWVQTGAPLDLALERLDATNLHGWCGNADTLRLRVPFLPASIVGGTVTAWNWFPADSMAWIAFSGEGQFYIADTLLPVHSPQAIGAATSLTAWPVPAQDRLQVISPGGMPGTLETFELRDIQGRHLGLQGIRRDGSGTAAVQWDLSALPGGVYICHTHSGQAVRIQHP